MHAPIRSVTALVALALCAACVPGQPPPADREAAPASAVAQAAPVPVVLLDPGHNGGNAAATAEINRPVPDGRGGTKSCNTTGTASDAGYPEHAFNWDLAQRVRTRLEAAGLRVVLTRPDDDGVGPCVDERGAAGGRAGAAAAVSLHADGAAPAARGFHVAHADPAVHAGPESSRLATALRDALRDGSFPPADYIGQDGLDGRDDLAGLNLSTVPTALVEAGNMRNAEEARLLADPAGRERYAEAISAGVLAFLGR
ncbi:N-acetylmuramoyl-L-alanine amidase [Pseudonocardia nematodicida]|uniref:N-acetylmuramoyl-L-alanine amidase n=1 Tax=Pseudonocardia nematodicida TaxID=1206997 RepID=A0ABV1K982_9PSEU